MQRRKTDVMKVAGGELVTFTRADGRVVQFIRKPKKGKGKRGAKSKKAARPG